MGGGNEVIPISGNIHHVKVLDNRIEGASNIGIDLVSRPERSGQPTNVLIKGNYVTQVGGHGGSSSGIYLDSAGKNIIVEDNIVEHNPRGITVNVEPTAYPLRSQYIIIRNNILRNNKINLKLGAGSYPNNLCQSKTEIEDAVAVHNTIVVANVRHTNLFFGCGEGLRWKNNIYGHPGGSSGKKSIFSIPNIDSSTWESDYNFFYNKSGSAVYQWQRKSYMTLNAFRNVSGLEINSKQGNPEFVNENQGDFRLQPESPAKDSGAALTFTVSAGSGMVITVADARYFSDGFGLQGGDIIRVGNNAAVTVTKVDYRTHTITVDQSISWDKDAEVNYDYTGSGPDFGATIRPVP